MIKYICGCQCLITLVFIVSMIYLTFMIDKQEITKKFIDILSNEQREKYYKIKNERRNIFLTGYGVGLILSLFVLFYKIYQNKSLNKWIVICLTGTITFITSYFYYILTPKSNYMILHLKTKEQKKEWLNVYKQMQYNYHMSFVFGILAVLTLSSIVC